MADPVEIPPPYVEMICQPGHGPDTCRYLILDTPGWMCAKHTSLGTYIDGRVAANTMNSHGDNCPGYGVEPKP